MIWECATQRNRESACRADLKTCPTHRDGSEPWVPVQKLTRAVTPKTRGAPGSPTNPDGASPR